MATRRYSRYVLRKPGVDSTLRPVASLRNRRSCARARRLAVWIQVLAPRGFVPGGRNHCLNCPRRARPGSRGGPVRRLPASLSEEAFKRAWKESRDSRANAGAAGVDRVTAETFASGLPDHIRRTRRLIQHGHYQFSPLRVAPVPKASGGERIIAIPTVRDRLLQRAILSHLEADSRFKAHSDISYGFVKGRRLKAAQERALTLRGKHPWALQTDIIKFFDRIDRNLLKGKVRDSIRSKVIAQLVSSAIDCELDERDPKARSLMIENQITRGRGLRQGMPLSPVLSNLLLRDFDKALVRAGLNVIRYADDMIVFADSEAECLAALSRIQDDLKALRLNIPELQDREKTKIRRPNQLVEFLGVDIAPTASRTYALRAPFRRIAKIEENLAKICTVEYCIEKRVTLPALLRSIESSIEGHKRAVAGLSSADDFVARLSGIRSKYSSALLISIIGKSAFESLSDEKLAVIGLRPFR